MRRILVSVVLACTQIAATPVHISGVVVDSSGKPIAKARIAYVASKPPYPETDENGRFSVEAPHSFIVVRKPGYHSMRVQLQDSSNLRVTLRDLKKGSLPLCASELGNVGLPDELTDLRFHKVPGVMVGPVGTDIDYSYRTYSVKSKSGRAEVRHYGGATWGTGEPSIHAVMAAAQFEEVVYEYKGTRVFDARGQSANGRLWRQVGGAFETASYADLAEDMAKILDRFLDGVCLKPWPRK